MQQSFPPINQSQNQNSASQQQQQQSSQENQASHLPVLQNQQQNQPQSNGIQIDMEEEDDQVNQQSRLSQQYQPQPPPPPSSTSASVSDNKSNDQNKPHGKEGDNFRIKSTPKYPFGLKEEPKKCRPTRGIKIDNLEKYLKERDYQSYLNELEIVELYADITMSKTVYVLLLGGYLLTKKMVQVKALIERSEGSRLDEILNGNFFAAVVSLAAEPNSSDMWKNVNGIYENDLAKEKGLSEYAKLFPIISQCMKEISSKKEVELSEQQEKMRKYLKDNKINKDKAFNTIGESARNLTEIDPNITK